MHYAYFHAEIPAQIAGSAQSIADAPFRINVPQISVSHLVARQALLAEMSDRFLNHTSSRTIVLLGMGGSGKTQLALEFCRQAEESLGFMAIIWIDASSPASVAQSYKIIAKNISKDRQDDVESDITISLVHNTLRGWKRWWLV